MQNPVRSIRHFNFADTVGLRLESVLPIVACSAAAATCRIKLMGWRRGNHQGGALRDSGEKPFMGKGRWVHTSLQTFGYCPSARFRCAPTGKWAYGDSFEAANDILDCFDISMLDIIDHYGEPEPDERMEWDLMELIETLAPDLLETVEVRRAG